VKFVVYPEARLAILEPFTLDAKSYKASILPLHRKIYYGHCKPMNRLETRFTEPGDEDIVCM